MNKSYTTDIIIVGAGIAGLTLACLLEKNTSYRVIIVDDGKAQRHRCSAVNSLSVKLWQHIDVWKPDILQASPYYHMDIWDHCGGKIHFDAPYIADDPLGFIVQDQLLHDALLVRVKQSTQLRLLAQELCQEVYEDHAQVCLQTETSVIYAQYLIACDGGRSWVREKMQFSMRSAPYNHTAITAQVVTETSHRQTAYQKFTEEGPLALLPFREIHHASIVWSVPPERADNLLALDDADFTKELNVAFESRLGGISQIGQRYAFPLTMRHVTQYVKNRVILCADAAHTIHPMAGQGLNLAIQDVIVLADAFIAIEQAGAATRNLRYYERFRKAENEQMIVVLSAIKRLYEIKSPEARLCISSGMSFVNKIDSLKSLMSEIASAVHHSPVWMT